MNSSTHMKGSIICVVGVLVLSFDTVLLRLIGHLPVMTVLFVKFALVAGTFLSIHVMDSREKCVEKFLNIGRLGFACGIVWGISNVFFTMAILTTYVANVLIIMACNSVFAAVFGYVVFGITQSLRTTVTCIVSIGAILLVCLTSILEKSDDDEVSGNVVLGNIYAIVASLTMGLYFVLLEQVSTLNPQLLSFDLLKCNIVSGAVVCLVALCAGGAPAVVNSTSALYLCLNGILVVPISYGLLTIGPAYISASEVTLFTLLETITGPVWVWLAGFEKPPEMTVYGGAILIAALATNSILAIREEAHRHEAIENATKNDLGHSDESLTKEEKTFDVESNQKQSEDHPIIV